MNKSKIIDQNSERNMLQERFFLSKMKNPFIVNMLCSFQDKENIYLVLQLLTGGDLRYHLSNYKNPFTEKQIKFLFSNIVLGLEYIHSKDIIHRDLKPENIIFDDKGYAYITDFGIAWSNSEEHNGDNSGTPGYMAPEALFDLEQDFRVDFYSIGVIGYEIIMGKTPYEGNSRHDIKKQMNEKDVYIDINDTEKYSDICIDFFNKLLNKKPEKRLGAKSGISEIKEHLFFKGLNWDLIYQHKYLSPNYDIIKYSKIKEGGEAEELFDKEYCHKKDTIGEETVERYNIIKNGKYFSKYFHNYSFLCVDNILQSLAIKKNKNIERVPVNEHLRKSQSINNIFYPKINSYNYTKNEVQKINDDNYLKYNYKYLPLIKNNIVRENAKREEKAKGYYEDKLLRYRDSLKNLHLNYMNKENDLNNKGFKILYEKNKENQPMQPIKIPEIRRYYNNLRYNDANINQKNNQYILNNNCCNNCNCSCHCIRNCNCRCNCYLDKSYYIPINNCEYEKIPILRNNCGYITEGRCGSCIEVITKE